MWPVINSEYELDDEEREEYAFRIYCDEAHARARVKAEADWQRIYEDARQRVEVEVRARRRGKNE